MTPRTHAARAAEVRVLTTPADHDALRSAPLAAVLLWGLGDGHADPVIGILRSLRLELDVLAAGSMVDADTLEAGVRAAGHRLDVAIELLRRLDVGAHPPAIDDEDTADEFREVTGGAT
jgi:hypothetical protein